MFFSGDDNDSAASSAAASSAKDYSFPMRIHKIWIGGKIPPEYLQDIAELAQKSASEGFSIDIWTDSSSRENNQEDFKKIPNLNVRNIEELLIKNLLGSPLFSDEEKTDILKCLIFESLPPPNRSVLSDYLRMLCLLEGGLYLDTDTVLKEGGHSANIGSLLGKSAEMVSDFGVVNVPHGSHCMLAAKKHPVLKIILVKMTEVLLLDADKWFKDLNSYEQFVKARGKETTRLGVIKSIPLYFRDRETFLIAKKYPYLVELGNLSFKDSELGQKMLGLIMLRESRDTDENGAKKYVRIPAMIKLAIDQGPDIANACIIDWFQSEAERQKISEEEAAKILNPIITLLFPNFDLNRSDMTWVPKEQPSEELKQSTHDSVAESVKFFEEHVNRLSPEQMLKLAERHGCDLEKMISELRLSAGKKYGVKT